MPRSGARDLRNISPLACSAWVAAISTWKRARPRLVTTSTVSSLACAARAPPKPSAHAPPARARIARLSIMRFATRHLVRKLISTRLASGSRRRKSGVSGGDLGDHQALGATGEPHQDVIAGLEIFQASAPKRFDMDENVTRLGVAHHEAVALGSVEPLELGMLGRSLRDQRAAAMTVRARTVAPRRTVGEGSLLALDRHRRRALVEIDDLADLPAFWPSSHVAHDDRAFHGGFAPAIAQRRHM